MAPLASGSPSASQAVAFPRLPVASGLPRAQWSLTPSTDVALGTMLALEWMVDSEGLGLILLHSNLRCVGSGGYGRKQDKQGVWS